MENEEIEIDRPFCYGCHRRIEGDFNMLANRRSIFPFHKDCFYKYLMEFRWKASATKSGVQGGLECKN